MTNWSNDLTSVQCGNDEMNEMRIWPFKKRSDSKGNPIHVKDSKGNETWYDDKGKRIPNPNQAEQLRCKHCGTVYTLGVDTVSITTSELYDLFGGVMVVNRPQGYNPENDIALKRSDEASQEFLQQCRDSILKIAPVYGWQCMACHARN